MILKHAIFLSRLLCLFTLITAPAWVYAKDASTIFTTTYRGEISGWNVEMKRSLVQTGSGEYEFSSEAKNMFASIRESSRFQLRDKHVRPLAYDYQRKVFGRRVRESIAFDWSKMTADYTRSDRSHSNKQHKLRPGLLDPSLYQLLMQKEASRGKKELGYSFVKRQSVRTYEFEQVGTDNFSFEGRVLKALVFKKRDDDSATTVWLIPELEYQIGKLTHIDDDGSMYQVHLSAYQRDPKALQTFYDSAL